MTGIRSILIIDDDEALANGMKKLLLRKGFVVYTATNGRLGLHLLEHGSIDLVITDIFMAEMEGLETIVALKQKFSNICIIAISGGSRVVGLDCLDLAKTLGADRILRKPVTLQALLETIQQLNSTPRNS